MEAENVHSVVTSEEHLNIKMVSYQYKDAHFKALIICWVPGSQGFQRTWPEFYDSVKLKGVLVLCFELEMAAP